MNYSQDQQAYQKQVFALAALLDDEHTSRVHNIWRVLETECDLKAMHVPPYPHFSFQVAQSYHLAELDRHVSSLANQLEPFRVRTTGLSVFTGKNPVVFVPVVSSETLLSIHKLIWENASPFGDNINHYYQPGHWVPHLTLIHDDVNADCLNCIFTQFINQSFVWEIEITKIAMIYQKGDQYGIHQVYPLAGG